MLFRSDFGGAAEGVEAFEKIDEFHNKAPVLQNAAIDFTAVLHLQIFTGAEGQGGDIFNRYKNIREFPVYFARNTEPLSAETESAAANRAETVLSLFQGAENGGTAYGSKLSLFHGGENFIEYETAPVGNIAQFLSVNRAFMEHSIIIALLGIAAFFALEYVFAFQAY